MRAQIVGREAQTNYQSLVTKYLFIVTEDWVCKLGVERGKRLRLLLARLDDSNMNRIVGVARP